MTSISGARNFRAAELAKATGLKVHLYGSLSATGKGHGTECVLLAGLIGKEPATDDPLFLDAMIVKPDETYPVKLGDKTFNLSLADIIYDATEGNFPHPYTMTCKLMAGDQVIKELEYYSVGGGFIEWKGYEPPKKGQPKYPYATMKELALQAQAEAHDAAASRVRPSSPGGFPPGRGKVVRRPRGNVPARPNACNTGLKLIGDCVSPARQNLH